MICDIPLTRTSEFCSRYGNHAIGLSKDWAMRNGVNPILYAADNDVITTGDGSLDPLLDV